MSGDKVVVFDGETYIRNCKSRYYFRHATHNSERKHAKQLHRAVWEHYNGEVPDGCHIHHIDGNVDNNDISNLECIPAGEHLSKHVKKNMQDPEYRERNRRQLDEARGTANLWHSSEAGMEWHRNHVQESLAKTWERTPHTCEFCGKTFSGTTRARFCSALCQQRARRASEGREAGEREKTCAWCGRRFVTFRGAQAYCCPSCRYEASKARRRKNG